MVTPALGLNASFLAPSNSSVMSSKTSPKNEAGSVTFWHRFLTVVSSLSSSGCSDRCRQWQSPDEPGIAVTKQLLKGHYWGINKRSEFGLRTGTKDFSSGFYEGTDRARAGTMHRDGTRPTEPTFCWCPSHYLSVIKSSLITKKLESVSFHTLLP